LGVSFAKSRSHGEPSSIERLGRLRRPGRRGWEGSQVAAGAAAAGAAAAGAAAAGAAAAGAAAAGAAAAGAAAAIVTARSGSSALGAVG